MRGLSADQIEALDGAGDDATFSWPTLSLNCYLTTATTGCCGGQTFVC